jgi:hypothetical protein
MDPIHPIRPAAEQPAAVAAIRPVPRAGAKRPDEQRRERPQRRQGADPAPRDEPGEHVDVRV